MPERGRTTKLWGARVEEVVASFLRKKRTFKWVRGELIGQGMYGQVYLALDATMGEMIAIRQVEKPRTPSDTVVEALKLEIDTLKVLDHPNIIKYLGFEETPTNLNMFLEYVSGGSIGSCLLKHGRFDEDVTKSFTSQILAGLEYLHSRRILHRDLKSSNILVAMSGVCKISNFGVSKRMDDKNATQTTTRGIVVQKAKYNVQIDIWRVGTVLLDMWAGEQSVGGELFGLMSTLSQSMQPPPTPDGLVLTPLAEDFRRNCFAMIPEERLSATELRRHPYLRTSPGWVFDGFAARSPASASSFVAR
ncbi:kinase-like domain-containing protein [Mycena capillaripes]|nr:kinase-like domain-containing protein [Mycena capillaripes]